MRVLVHPPAATTTRNNGHSNIDSKINHGDSTMGYSDEDRLRVPRGDDIENTGSAAAGIGDALASSNGVPNANNSGAACTGGDGGSQTDRVKENASCSKTSTTTINSFDGDQAAARAAAAVAGEEVGGGLESLVEVAAMQAVMLGALEGEAALNATTLVVARPPLALKFGDFLAAAEAVDDFIDDAGLRGIVQVRKMSSTV